MIRCAGMKETSSGRLRYPKALAKLLCLTDEKDAGEAGDPRTMLSEKNLRGSVFEIIG